MEEIAAQADVTKPLVYAYFGSKESLYVAYIERSGRELLDRMRAAADPDAPPTERLCAGILEFLGFVEERRNGWQVLYSEAAARGGPLAEELASLRAGIARMIGRLLKQTTADAELSDETAAALDGVAHAVVGAGESLANWWLAHPELPPEQAAELLVALAQAGADAALSSLWPLR
jgi:AcrR family transcriptional regulator